MAEGFLHPRCKDGHTTYIPGVTSIPDPVTQKEEKEAAKAEVEEQREQLAKRQEEKFSRLAENSLDPENKRIYEARADRWKLEAEKYREKANIAEDTMVRMNYEKREIFMQDIRGNKELLRILRRARYRDGAPSEKFVDITATWFSGIARSSKSVSMLKEYVVNEISYIVDGFHVIMDPSPNEIRIAELLHEKIGLEVSIVPKINYPLSIRTPDYLLNGIGYDLKTIEGAGQSTLRDAVKRKKGQSNRFIFDLSKSKLTAADVKKQMHGMFGDPHTAFVDEIVIIRGDEIESVYRRIK